MYSLVTRDSATTHCLLADPTKNPRGCASVYACPETTWLPVNVRMPKNHVSHIRMRKFVYEKNACGIYRYAATGRLLEHRLATSVGSVLGKPGPPTHPSCYFSCLHRAQNGQKSVEVSHAAYWLVHLVFTP